MAEGITLAMAITIHPIVRLHKTLAVTTAVLVTSADAGNFRKLSICLERGLAGNLSNEVPLFALWIKLLIIHLTKLRQKPFSVNNESQVCTLTKKNVARESRHLKLYLLALNLGHLGCSRYIIANL